MIIGVIFKDGIEIDRGIMTGDKQWAKDYPEQSITICDSCDAYSIENKRTYDHGNNISFQELQDNGNGWEIVYDSNERIDKTVYYSLPNWMFNINASIPNYKTSMNKDGEVEKEFKGYVK